MLVLNHLIRYIKRKTNINQLYNGYIRYNYYILCVAYVKNNKPTISIEFVVNNTYSYIIISTAENYEYYLSNCDINKYKIGRHLKYLVDLMKRKFIRDKYTPKKCIATVIPKHSIFIYNNGDYINL